MLALIFSVMALYLFVFVARAADFSSSRSWIEVEIPYFGQNSIYLKVIVHTAGNRTQSHSFTKSASVISSTYEYKTLTDCTFKSPIESFGIS
jgi:hypothetical protein